MKRTMLIMGILTGILLNAQQLRQEHFELVKIADKVREAFTSFYWDEWHSVPFSILLVKDDYEYLLHTQTEDTTFQKDDEGMPFRKATFNKHFLATFPLIDQQPTIVVGTPRNTNKSPEGWIVTILHEHFHQLQFSHPEYYITQSRLGLAKGDDTGMWMLNHPFPYDQPEVMDLIKKMSDNLLKTYAEKVIYQDIRADHVKLKSQLKKIVAPEDYIYLNLQLWQEGFARYMEIRLLEDWIRNFDQVDQKMISRVQLENLLLKYHQRIKTDLTSADLAKMEREYFYSFGAAEAFLISKTYSNWIHKYFDKLYTTDHLLVSR